MSINKKKAHILGAGPIGLVCGWKLAEHGYDVSIYERTNRVGGMCASWKWNDFILDVGPHIFHTPDKKLAKFWQNEFGHILSCMIIIRPSALISFDKNLIVIFKSLLFLISSSELELNQAVIKIPPE